MPGSNEARETRRAEGVTVLGVVAIKAPMICWADPQDPEVQAYVRGYWDFQEAFKNASGRFKAGALDVAFPSRAFRPVSYSAPPSETSNARS